MIDVCQTDTLKSVLMAKESADILHHYYPGYVWKVSAIADQGVVNIVCGNHGAVRDFGFRLFKDNAASSSEWQKKVVMAGGELLERAKLSRTHLTKDAPKQIDGVPDRLIIR